MKWICMCFATTVFFLNSCKKEFQLPINYNGFAILQTKDLPDDGVNLYTFYLLPKLEKKHPEKKINYDRLLVDKSITFIFTQGTHYLKYKRELYKRDWQHDEDLILVKLNYNILIPEWKEYTKISSKKITIENKDYTIEDYDFYNLVNNKGEALYKINNIEYIKKIN